MTWSRCPACGQAAMTVVQKLTLGAGARRECAACRVPVGWSSSCVFAFLWFAPTWYLATKASSWILGLAWIALGGVLAAAVLVRFVPLWIAPIGDAPRVPPRSEA